MSSKGWRKNTSITRKLTNAPHEFQFLQAVRLLERSTVFEKESTQSPVAANPLAAYSPPLTEAVRFATNQSLGFPSSEIKHLERTESAQGTSQWQMVVNLMGLTGAMGVLPYHYTELILKRQKQKDATLEHFIDLFNHRTLSLFFQASIKYRLPFQYERSHLQGHFKSRTDPHTTALLSLIGLGTKGLNDRLYTRDESLIYYSGLLTHQVRSVTGLKQLLRSHFDVPVEIEQFIGQWQDLIDDVRTRLADFNEPQGRNACLGRNAMLGKRGWFAQGKIHIVLGPLNSQQLQRFKPGTPSLKALNEIVRFYLGMEHEYDFIIRINKKDIPQRVSLNKNNNPTLSWNTWLGQSEPGKQNTDENIDIHIGASRLR